MSDIAVHDQGLSYGLMQHLNIAIDLTSGLDYFHNDTELVTCYMKRIFMKSLVHFHSLQQSLHDYMPLVEGIVCHGVFFSQNEPASFDPTRFENNHLYISWHGEQATTEYVDAGRHLTMPLTMLRFALARFISKFYTEMDHYGTMQDTNSVLSHLDQTFLHLENAVFKIPDLAQISILEFVKLENYSHADRPIWISINESRLDNFLILVLARYRRQRNTGYQSLVRAVGSSLIAAMWMIKRYFNLKQICEAMNAFVSNVVVKPITYLRVGLLKTSEEEEQLMELGDVKATSNLLHN